MEKMKTALDSLNQAIQKLEGAVVAAKAQKTQDKEKIETLHGAVITAYERIDRALSHMEGNTDGDSHI